MEVWRPQASCWHAGGSVGCVDLAGLLGTRQATLSPLPCSCRNTLLPSLCRLLNACGRVRTRANRLQTIFSSISLRALSMRGFFHALLSFAFSACGADRRFETALAIICVSRMLSARMPIRATHTIIVCGLRIHDTARFQGWLDDTIQSHTFVGRALQEHCRAAPCWRAWARSTSLGRSQYEPQSYCCIRC